MIPVECREVHWRRHRFLCTGEISDNDAESHPLIQFKCHACETNEIFLLVADVFTQICSDIDLVHEQGNVEDMTAMISKSLAPYENFVRNRWWDIVESTKDNYVGMLFNKSPTLCIRANSMQSTLKSLVTESWGLLKKVLELDRRGLTDILSVDYMSR